MSRDGADRRILGVATQGAGGDDELRLRTLLAPLGATFFPFDRARKRASGRDLLRTIRRDRPDLVVMEGTGVFGGLALLQGAIRHRVPFVVSSGDAVEPFVRAKMPAAGPAFGAYERALCARSAGFIGWTPYLAGRALTFGAPRAMTAPGWAPYPETSLPRERARAKFRARLGIPADALVVGIVGSMPAGRSGYCYGRELVEAMVHVKRPDAHVVVVGDGTGRPLLQKLAGDRLDRTVHLPGRIPREQVPDALSAFDIASLPQTVDGIGSFRYTTKISEYLAARLPVVTGRIPLGYDLDAGWIWRLPGLRPWDALYTRSLAALIDRVTPDEIARRRDATARSLPLFDRDEQVARVAAFLSEILDDRPRLA